MSNTNRHSVSIDDFADELVSCFAKYKGNVTEAIEETVSKTAKATVKELKIKAPKQSGRYAKSFAQKRSGNDGEKIVYNKEHYHLTHLLEHGHAMRNGGRTKPISHIGPARGKSVKELEENIIQIIKRGGK